MARAIATKESVERAADEILAKGDLPTAEAVRDRIGGGSYSTISKLLRDYMEAAEHAKTVASELPDAVSRLINDAIARVASVLDAESKERVDAVVRSGTEKQQKLSGELDAASREIERLELAVASSEQERKVALDAQSIAEKHEAEARGSLKTTSQQVESLSALLEIARSDHLRDLAEERERARCAESRASAAEQDAAELRGRLQHFIDSERSTD